MKNRRTSSWIACFVILLVTLASGVTFGQAPNQDSANPAPPWPRKFVSGTTTISLYQPQLEKWQDNQVNALAAVEVQTGGSKDATYGVIWFTARTEVDKINREVTALDFNFTKFNFPTAPNNGQDYVNILKQEFPTQSVFSLDNMEADLNLTDAQMTTPQKVVLDNTPPTVFFSTSTAVLVLIDGPATLRPVQKTKLQRVINTRTLILYDPKKNIYYLQLMDGWVSSTFVQGPWQVEKKPPKELNNIKDQLSESHQITLLEVTGPNGNQSLKNGVPIIYVSATPAELLQTQGPPDMIPIPGTELLFVKNTASNIFMNTGNQQYYVLISGRWFSAASMSGPWNYVAGASLPADFAKIPTDSPKASALASVPGTPQAKEGLIANAIPQTATITRSAANLTVSYDGAPQFDSVKDTSLKYARNTATPVVEVSQNSYYAVQNGVWFQSGSALGPWAVATSVPGVIYTIPPTSPIYYVTFVKVYGSTNSVVYTGYTPGYYGTVVSTANVVVYGTGYYYPPYIGTTWIGTPYTYGVGATFAWGVAAGWALGFGIGYASSSWYPWWGPVGYWGGYYGGAWGAAYGWGGWGGACATNVYGHWGNAAYSGTRAAWANPYTGNVGTGFRGTAYNPVTGAETAGRGFQNTNVYTGKQTGAAGGVHYNPTTGIVSGGRAGYTGNMYTGNYEAGGKGFAYDTKTGQGVSGGGVYGDHDGNVYKQGGSGWQQWDHNSGSWGDAGASHNMSGLNNWSASRNFGNFRGGGFRGGGGFRR